MKNKVLITALGVQALLENESYKTGDFHQALLDIAYADWNRHNDSIVYAVTDYDTKALRFRGTTSEIKAWRKRLADEGRADEANSTRVKKDDDRDEWGYAEMLDNAREKYGELFFALVAAGKYNQQVGNGGHLQYFHNGYGDGEGGFGHDHDPSMPLHREMIKSLETEILPLACGDEREPLEKALRIMKDVRIIVDRDSHHHESCEECGGSGNVTSGDDDEEERCGECDGTGEVEVENDNYNEPNRDILDRLDDRWYAIDDQAMAAFNSLACRIMNSHGMEDAPAIAAAEAEFRNQYERARADREYLMPGPDALGLAGAGKTCYDLLVEHRLKLKYLEEHHILLDDEAIVTFRRNRATDAYNKMYERFNEMKPGERIEYWAGIADVYDEDDEHGVPRADIREAYEKAIDDQLRWGCVKPVLRDEDGNEVDEVVDGVETWGYEKLPKK